VLVKPVKQQPVKLLVFVILLFVPEFVQFVE